jgi:2-dehydropantoate 2-reductase
VRIGFVGIGAIGTLFAFSLAQRNEVRVLVRDEETARTIARRGGLIVDDGPPRAVRLGSDPSLFADIDVAIVAVKTYATVEALRPLRGHLPIAATVASLQNGAVAVAQIEQALGPRPAIALAPTTEAATLVEPGIARRTSRGRTRVGWAPKHDFGETAAALAAAFSASGLDASYVASIEPYVWEKLVINAAINPVTALAGVPNGALIERIDLWRRVELAAREATAVAVALGIVLPFQDHVRAVASVIRATAANRSSMLQDLERGRPTEIDEITGAVVRYAVARGIPITENVALLDEMYERMDEVRERTNA